jgi:hypothetical protein
VESEDDPVVLLLQQLTHPLPQGKCEIVIAGRATNRGQKIHNQLAAVAHTTEADEVLVFMDADAHPNNSLLPALVPPLFEEKVGATTGYRIYVPHNTHPATTNLCIINASIAALLGPPSRNHAWGGSMAITRKNFFDLGIHEAWQHALSDDYVLSHQIRNVHKKIIRFSHASFLPSVADFNWKSFFEFAPRQYKITKVCAPSLWLITLVGCVLYFFAFAAPLVTWLVSLAIGRHDPLFLYLFLGLYGVNILRGYFLLRGCKAAFPQHARKFQRIGLWFILGLPIALFVNLLALLASAVGRTIRWRGIAYTMHSMTETSVARPREPEPALAIGAAANAAEVIAEPASRISAP